MWNLKQNAGTIACGFIGTSGPTVMEVNKYLFAVFDYAMVAYAIYIYNRTNPQPSFSRWASYKP